MRADERIRLLLVDDRAAEAAALGERLSAEPGLAVLGTLGGAEARPERLPSPAPDLLLVDHATLGRRGGVGLLGPLHAAPRGLRALVLARTDDDDTQLACAAAGAIGCVPRTLAAPELARAVQHAHAGNVLFSSGVLLRLLHDGAAAPGLRVPRPVRPLLSARECAALEAVAEGLTVREAAERLSISPHTLRTHIRNAVQKLAARSTVHAVARALQAGLVDPRA
jgi:DNA-binding NarL/FixJ family response regulator